MSGGWGKQSRHLVAFLLWWCFDATSKRKNNQPALLVMVVVLLWCVVMQCGTCRIGSIAV